jgi:glycosyltransferase involved in cell wall biosynthesis
VRLEQPALNICIVHNSYGNFSGEEAVVQNTISLLQRRNHKVILFTRSSAEIEKMFLGKFSAFLSGIYSYRARTWMKRLLSEHEPDIVHVHNLLPLISPSVIVECNRANVPVVMTVHNYRLVCPNGLFVSHGSVCEDCAGGREYWAILRNCENSVPKSIGYAIRTWIARKMRFYLNHVTIYATLTDFQRRRLIREGYPAERILVVPNMIVNSFPSWELPGKYVGYVGRVSPEKGISTFMLAAEKVPEIPCKVAGAYDRMPDLPLRASKNFSFLGHLNGVELNDFFSKCSMIVIPSICFEGFPIVLLEAMLRGKAVVCSRIGGLPEIVEDGITGLLFEAGNATDLVEKILYLWERPDLCQKMGEAGRRKAFREYSEDRYYEQIMAAYERAIALGPGGPKA